MDGNLPLLFPLRISTFDSHLLATFRRGIAVRLAQCIQYPASNLVVAWRNSEEGCVRSTTQSGTSKEALRNKSSNFPACVCRIQSGGQNFPRHVSHTHTIPIQNNLEPRTPINVGDPVTRGAQASGVG